MRTLALLLVLVSPAAFPATINVCKSGCGPFTTAQYALEHSADGDTIVFAAGQNYGPLDIPGNRHNLTFKSSLIDKYPRNYRIVRNASEFARLTTVSAGDPYRWSTINSDGKTLTSRPGGGVLPHGLSKGDKVVIGGSRFSAYHCARVNQPPYTTGACDAARVGFLNIRMSTGLANGMGIGFIGRTLPPPLQSGRLYYVVNFTFGGSGTNADKFQVSATRGGPPIPIPQFDPTGQDLVVEVPPLPQHIGDVLYVAATPTRTTVQLSATPNGPPIVFTQTGKGYDGSHLATGFSLTRTAPVHDITFDGLEVFPTSDAGIYYPFYFSSAIASDEGEHYNIRILRCWVHGADDQQSFPMATINIAARNLEIGWSIVENAYSTGNDTQGIGFMSTGDVNIHDNEIKGTAEGIMSGGNFPWFAFKRNTKGIRIYRNYLWKPLKAYVGIVAARVGPTQFRFESRYGGADCASVARNPNLGLRCFAYESDEADPAKPRISRTEWIRPAADSLFTASGSAGQVGFIYLLNGKFHMDYNFSGSVTCPEAVVCQSVARPAFSPESTRVGIAVIAGNGTFDGSFYQENRNVFSKNLIESKYGDNWLIEGNVFHRQDNCDGGGTCQDPAIQFTVAANGSGPGDPLNYMVSSSNSIIRNNIFRHLSSGIVGVGKTFPVNNGGTGLAFEFNGFGKNTDNQVVNNLFMDMGSSEYSPINGGTVVRMQNTERWVIEHNTAVDVRMGFLANGVKATIYRSNILTPYRSSGSRAAFTHPAPVGNIGVLNDFGAAIIPWFGGEGAGSWNAALAGKNIDSACQFTHNILMNRPGFVYHTARGIDYPQTTYLIEPNDTMPGKVLPDPSVLFTTWHERDNSVPPNGLNYRAGNYRLAPGMAAAYPAHDQRAIGADIDEIEALTGRSGVDVERGWPTFAERSERKVSSGPSGTVVSYKSNGSPCTIQAWANSAYSGPPVVNLANQTAESVPLPGLKSGVTYHAKRWCGSEVDVFSFTAGSSEPPK